MNKYEIRRCVRHFRKEYLEGSVTCEKLCDALEKLGYTVVEFSNVANDKPVSVLLNALSLEENAANARGFTYADKSYRLVFVHRELSEQEKLIVLSHELGHIYLDHLKAVSVIGRDVREEFEANEFAHYLLDDSLVSDFFRRHKGLVLSVAAAAIAAVVTVGVLMTVNSSKYYGEYYVCQTGSKFHTRDCAYIAGKTKLHRLTREEYDSGAYQPCKRCLPELQQE